MDGEVEERRIKVEEEQGRRRDLIKIDTTYRAQQAGGTLSYSRLGLFCKRQEQHAAAALQPGFGEHVTATHDSGLCVNGIYSCFFGGLWHVKVTYLRYPCTAGTEHSLIYNWTDNCISTSLRRFFIHHPVAVEVELHLSVHLFNDIHLILVYR